MSLIKRINLNKDGRLFGISLFFVGIVFLILKIITIFFVYRYLSPIKHCISYFASDLLFFMVILLLLIINFRVKNGIIRGISNVLIFFFIVLYCIDIFTIHYFLTRESVFSIRTIIKYGGNGGKGFLGIVLFWVCVFLLIWLICYILLQYKSRYYKFIERLSLKNFLFYYLFSIGMQFIIPLLGIVFYIFLPDVKDILSINVNATKELCQERILFAGDYTDYIKYEDGEGKELNIILVFGESISPIDSKLLGGNNNMPNFDKIQMDGLYFTNFISNGTDSIMSHQSVLLGIPPINKVGYYNYITEYLPQYLNNQGFITIFISTASLKFLDERAHLNRIGFDKIIGEEAFENEKKYTRGAAPDEALYNMALQEIKTQTGKYFMALPTISFHKEYDCPYGNTEKECLKYTDDKLYEFYTSLKNLGFFDSGILIIVGDHRKREPIEKGEYNLFGASWENRGLAVVVGSGIDKNTINSNVITHTDLYYSLKKLLGKDKVKVDIYYNDIFASNANRNWGILEDSFIFKEGDQWVRYDIKTLKKKHNDIYLYYIALKNLQLIKNILTKQLVMG